MQYENVVSGIFRERPNRFVAHVEISGKLEVVHVKNTGRCRELLIPGVRVWCERAKNPERKTKFDLIAVEKAGTVINMDSQAPNKAAGEWLSRGGLGEITELKPEYKHGDSRFDFSFLKDGKRCFLEVKGVTLEENGVARFPDAPTERGAKHLRGLKQAISEGFGAYALFVIQMTGISHLEPNDKTDPAFGAALREAQKAGVEILAMDCRITPDTMTIDQPVPVQL